MAEGKSTIYQAFECSICGLFVGENAHICSQCGTLVCEMCSQVIIRLDEKAGNLRRDQDRDCPTCRSGRIDKSKFVDQLMTKLFTGEKLDCHNLQCPLKFVLYPDAYKRHQRVCDSRLVLCPSFPATCQTGPTTMQTFFTGDAHVGCFYISKAIFPNDADVYKLRFRDELHIDSPYHEYTSERKRLFKPVFFDRPDLLDIGLHFQITRELDGQWYFDFLTFVSSLECAKYDIKYVVFRPRPKHEDHFICLASTTSTRFKNIPYFEFMDLITPYAVSETINPLPRFSKTGMRRHELAIFRPQNEPPLEKLESLRDRHVRDLKSRDALFEIMVVIRHKE